MEKIPEPKYEYQEIKRSDNRKSNQFKLIYIEYFNSKTSSTGFVETRKKYGIIYKSENLANLICILLNKNIKSTNNFLYGNN